MDPTFVAALFTIYFFLFPMIQYNTSFEVIAICRELRQLLFVIAFRIKGTPQNKTLFLKRLEISFLPFPNANKHNQK